ncbi:hypothetical protein F4703DRAFT_1845513, partial [Phycomyces blakesleeanus]
MVPTSWSTHTLYWFFKAFSSVLGENPKNIRIELINRYTNIGYYYDNNITIDSSTFLDAYPILISSQSQNKVKANF